MKNLKFIVFVLIFAVLFSCGDDNSGTPAFVLSTSSVSGNYEMQAFTQVEDETATSTSGAEVNLSKTTKNGDIYRLTLTLNENGTYTAIGEYTFDFVTAPNGSAQETGSDIVDVNDSGTFSVNSTNNTITFTASSSLEDEFINNTYTIVSVNSTILSISQESSESSGSNTIAKTTDIGFVKE